MTPAQASLRRVRILILDDETSVLELYLIILKPSSVQTKLKIMMPPEITERKIPGKYNLEATLCSSSSEALAAVGKTALDPFSIVFLDVHLANERESGVMVAEKIRQLDGNIQIVLITGDTTLDMSEIGRRIPPGDKLFYLNKPFKPIEIRQFVDSLSEKWFFERQLEQTQQHLESMVKERTEALSETSEKLVSEMDQRKRFQDSLRHSEENFRKMISQNADGIIIIDRAGIVQFVNPAGEMLFGKSTEELVGKPFGFEWSGELRKEIEVESNGGKRTVCEMRISDIEWEGSRAAMASLRDITERKELEENLRLSLDKLQITMRGTVQVIARLLETKDPYTAGHQKRVSELASSMAVELGLSGHDQDGLLMAALIHDIGKISIPSEILSKPGKLNEIEYDLIKTHSQIGYEILREIEFPWPVADIVRQHHEKLDGSGYPEGIHGDKILYMSKILTVADVVEAVSSHRPYRAALGVEKGLEHIIEMRGIFYEPEIVDTCVNLFREKNFEFKAMVWPAKEYSDQRPSRAAF